MLNVIQLFSGSIKSFKTIGKTQYLGPQKKLVGVAEFQKFSEFEYTQKMQNNKLSSSDQYLQYFKEEH